MNNVCGAPTILHTKLLFKIVWQLP